MRIGQFFTLCEEPLNLRICVNVREHPKMGESNCLCIFSSSILRAIIIFFFSPRKQARQVFHKVSKRYDQSFLWFSNICIIWNGLKQTKFRIPKESLTEEIERSSKKKSWVVCSFRCNLHAHLETLVFNAVNIRSQQEHAARSRDTKNNKRYLPGKCLFFLPWAKLVL